MAQIFPDTPVRDIRKLVLERGVDGAAEFLCDSGSSSDDSHSRRKRPLPQLHQDGASTSAKPPLSSEGLLQPFNLLNTSIKSAL